jgi:type II secretory pathway pseudopilin PulG
MMRNRNISNKKRGITLTEALISILIMGFALVALLGTFFVSKLSTFKAQHHMEAMNHARAAMEELIDDVSATYTLPDGTIKDLGGSYSQTITTSFMAGISKVEVTISWNEESIRGTIPVSETLVMLIRE